MSRQLQTISAVARRAECCVDTVRAYDAIIEPMRDSRGARLYTEEQAARVAEIIANRRRRRQPAETAPAAA